MERIKNDENALKADHAQYLKVTNDNAERVVALIQQYNLLHIRDEKIKLFQEHSKKLPPCKKTVLNY